MNNKMRWRLNNWHRKPFVTYIILIMHVLLFLLMEFFGSSQDVLTLFTFGAKENYAIASGEWWRLITPMFLHIGILHLVMNSILVYYLGSELERVYGHWKYAVIYLASGIAGNALSFAFNDAVSAGASTAIFGLFATTLVLAKANPRNPAIQAVAENYRVLIIINIVFNVFSTGVDLAGHLGGLLGGYLISTTMTYPVKSKISIVHSVGYILVMAAIIVIGLFTL